MWHHTVVKACHHNPTTQLSTIHNHNHTPPSTTAYRTTCSCPPKKYTMFEVRHAHLLPWEPHHPGLPATSGKCLGVDLGPDTSPYIPKPQVREVRKGGSHGEGLIVERDPKDSFEIFASSLRSEELDPGLSWLELAGAASRKLARAF